MERRAVLCARPVGLLALELCPEMGMELGKALEHVAQGAGKAQPGDKEGQGDLLTL